MAINKTPISTAITATTVTYPSTAFAATSRFWRELRDCKRDASAGTVEALQKIVPVIRQRFGPRIRIVVRADSGFAREAIMSWCETNGVFYCLGLARNERLQKELQANFEALKAQISQGQLQSPCRSFTEFEYATRDSWSRPRRVIGKAEVLAEGDNPRFIVTNLPADGWAEPARSGPFCPGRLV
jgi:hypothetical protein